MAAFIPISTFQPSEKKNSWELRRKEILPLPPARVWQAFTRPDELERWWCDTARVDLVPGGALEFGGPTLISDAALGKSPAGEADRESQDGLTRCEILRVTEGELLEFRWELAGVPTTVTIHLENQFEQTHLRVTQSADSPLSWSDDPAQPNWWWVALVNLRNYLENGSAPLRFDYLRALERGRDPVHFSVSFTTFPWVIWKKLTDPEEIRSWWSDGVKLAAEAGATFESGTSRFLQIGTGPEQVLEVEPEKTLKFDWGWPDGSRGTVTWTIEEEEASTRVTLVIEDPHEDPDQPLALPLEWAIKLLYLKQMSERGITPLDYQES